MVLQDADAGQDSFTDNSSSSNFDPYASNPSTGRQQYDASSMPQPLPIIGPILGFTGTSTRFKVDSTLKFAGMKLQRPLTGEESQALATHLYTLEQRKSYFATIGAVAGVGRWYNTWESYRYPMYKPKPEDINPNKFLFFKGPAANYARHSWRMFCYVFVASELGKLVGTIVAQPMAGQATSDDPRLAHFNEDLKHAVASDAARMANRNARSSADERRAAWEEAARARNAERSVPGAPAPVPWNARKPTPADDDMSPTAGNESWPSSSDTAWGSETMSSDSPPESQRRQQPISFSDRSSRREPRRDDDDDMSPTGGMFQDEVRSQSKPGESAWERLRRGGAPPPQGPPPSMSRRRPPYQEQREGSTLGDSFTFVDSDDERRAERERAQREFDARIEQERQGNDFDEEKRW